MARSPFEGLSWPGRILLKFCRPPGTPDYPSTGVHYDSGKELQRLEEVFPDFAREIKGKVVFDFGCGEGYQTVAFTRAGAAQVIGIEIDDRLRESARKRVAELGPGAPARVQTSLPADLKAEVIVSQNSFEHFLDAGEILNQIRQALAPNGRLFVTFAPPWYAPWGAHMAFFCRLPWVQLFFSERTIMEVRSLFRADDVRTYRGAGLAQMTVARFERLIAASGFTFESRRYDCVHQMNWLARTPVRELFVNRVSCVLTGRPSTGPEY